MQRAELSYMRRLVAVQLLVKHERLSDLRVALLRHERPAADHHPVHPVLARQVQPEPLGRGALVPLPLRQPGPERGPPPPRPKPDWPRNRPSSERYWAC